MGPWTSMFNVLGMSFFAKKGKNLPNGGEKGKNGKNGLVLRSSGILTVGSDNLASVFMRRGQKGVNQDCCIVWEEFGCESDMLFCGIFDGHGPWGHYVAKTVRELLPASLLLNYQETSAEIAHAIHSDLDTESDDDDLQWLEIWRQCYLKTCASIDQKLEHHKKVDAFYSGTTALSIVKQGEKIIIANVGDSRAVLATTSDDGNLVAIQLTVDFKPNLPQEAERIRQCQGRVFCLNDEPGVHRVWLPDEETPGLAMSRAFGDYCMKNFGLISVPEVSLRNLSDKDHFVVLATDGVWDVISNEDAVQIISSCRDQKKAAKRLVNEAVNAWRKKRRGFAIDDISAICLFFNPAVSDFDSVK